MTPKTKPSYVCAKDLAPFLSGFLSQQPGRKGQVKLEPIPVNSDLHRDLPCCVCGGPVHFEVRPL